jgi:hypothetical protein
VATDLDPFHEYTVTITKRTEAQTRGALSTFKVMEARREWIYGSHQ